MMSRHEFLHFTVSFNLDHVFFVATSFFKSRLHLFTFQFLLQSQIVDVVTWNCWKLNFLSRLKFLVVTSILLQADFFLFLLKFDFLLYFPANWNLSQLSIFYRQFNIIFILNSEKWIKNLMSFWTHQAHRPCRRLCRAPAHAAARRVAASSVVSRSSWSYRGACLAVSQHCIATQPVATPSSCHDTNDCIMTHPTSQASLLSRYNRLYRDTPQRPVRSPVTIQLIVSRHTLPARPPSCHDTTDCIVTHLSSQATLLS